MNRMAAYCALACLYLPIAQTPFGFAQPQPRPMALPAAWLELRFDRRGDVRLTLTLPFTPRHPILYRHLLRTILRVPLDRVREKSAGGQWTLDAHAAGVLHRSGWTVEGDLNPEMLLRILSAYGVQQLAVSLHHPRAGFSDCSLAASPVTVLDTTYSAVLSAGSSPSPLHVAFGYRPADAWRFAPLALVLLAPIALTLRQRGRRRGNAEDRFAEWFRAEQFYRWLLIALWYIWPMALIATGAVSRAGFLLGDIVACGEWTWTAWVLLLPPALTAIACKVLSAPAFAGVPEMGWTRGRLLRQALWLQLGIVAVGVCLGYSVDAVAEAPLSKWGFVSFLPAVALIIICWASWAHSRQAVAEALLPGELRERLFELAEQAQVRVRQVFLLPPAPWRLLNVLSLVEDAVYLTPGLLPHLSRREVDALLALELARLWRKRSLALWRWLIFALLITGFCTIAGTLAGSLFARLESTWAIWIVFFALALGFRSWRGNRFAPFLDRHALAVTGDPEAMLTMLAKLRRLHLLPLATGDKGFESADTSPADWPRLQKLADRASIPPVRLREILDRPGSGEDRYDPLPATPGIGVEDTRVFSREFKARTVSLLTETLLTVDVAVPALVAYFVQTRQWQGVWLAAAYLFGLLLAVLLRRLAVKQIGWWTSRALRRGVRRKLESEGWTPLAWGGFFVGLSPHDKPRQYEHFINWDIGCMILAGDRLCYLGDRTRFALDRAAIQDMYQGPGPERSSKRLYVVWRDEARGVGGTFNLSNGQAGPPWRRGPGTAELEKRLRDWLKQPAEPSELPMPLRQLPPPDFGDVPGEPPGRLAAGTILFNLLMLRAPFVIVACFLLGLSFERDAGPGGWYVVAAVTLLQMRTVQLVQRSRGRQSEENKPGAQATG